MDYKKELMRYAALAEDRGFVTSLEGNVSIMDRETGLTYITPSGCSKTFMTEDQIAVMDQDGNQIGGSVRRSSEYLLHEAGLKARPDLCACIHTHSPYLSAYAWCHQPIRIPCTCQLIDDFEVIPCLPYGTPGTHDIHKGIEEALAKVPIVLLGHHGAFAMGASLSEALGLLQFAENQCKTYEIAKKVCVPKPFESYDGVREEIIKRNTVLY